MESDKEKILKQAINVIEKQYGKGSVMQLGQKFGEKIPVISTGVMSLDVALGVGGLPRGRIVEIFGPESSGKTTVALHVAAEIQKNCGIVSYIDAEHALDPVYAKNLGVDINSLYVSQPDNGEQALEIAESMLRSNVVDLIVIDSVAALVPKAEIDGNMGDAHMGLHARLMSQALRKLAAVTNKANAIVIFINQLRQKIGISYGNPETTTGGRALKFYASIRLEIRKSDALKNGDEIYGNKTKVKIVKNKVAPPFKTCEFDIIYGEGISQIGDVLDLSVELNLIEKSGSWYSYNDTKLGQGRDNAKNFIKNDLELFSLLKKQICEYYKLTI
ncbi:MAG: recombinase RecA [Clostridiales bacterium]|jgi:recombination protein RecA|nr:recombinase RecA [Clostridiales bacterium]